MINWACVYSCTVNRKSGLSQAPHSLYCVDLRPFERTNAPFQLGPSVVRPA